MIQLKLTNEGLSAFTNTTNYKLTLTHFVFGSSYDDTEQAIQDESPLQFNIDFQETYLKGQTYQRNGSDVVEEYNHIKIIGYFSADNVSTFDENGEYIVHELALMGSTTENNNICLAYGYDVEGIKLYENTDTIYTVKLDLIFDKVPNIEVNNSVGTVTYRDFLDHVDKKLTDSTPVHGLQLINNRLYINGQPLTIDVEGVSNAKMDNIVGIDEEVEVLPATTNYSVGDVVAIKDTGTMYKNTEVLNNNTLENQWIATGSINSQLGILNSYGSMIPLRTNNTAYVVGDPVKTQLCKPFQYLECIASGTSGNGSVFSGVNTIGDNEVGTTYVDGTCIWLCCDMRDGLQAGDMKYRFSLNDIDGYIKMDTTRSLLYFDKDNPITNDVNFKYLRLFRLILNQALYTYTKDSLFDFEVSVSPSTASTNPILLHGAGVVLINQWCNLSPLGFSTIEDITLQDYIDISTYNTNNSVSYTEAQYKETAQKLLDDILNNSTGIISIRISDITNRYIKLQGAQKEWTSRLEDEGLPNITGNLGNLVSGSNANNNPSSGALRWGGRGTVTRYQNAYTTTANNWYDPAFDASSSNSIYGNSSHVTPASLHLCPFMKY